VLLFVVFVLAHPREKCPFNSPAPSASAVCPALPHHFPCTPKSFRMNTCESVSKQRTLTTFRMNTCEKQGEGGASSRSFIASLPHCFTTSQSSFVFNTTSNSEPRTSKSDELTHTESHRYAKPPGGGGRNAKPGRKLARLAAAEAASYTRWHPTEPVRIQP
jgi:hypothetical protein